MEKTQDPRNSGHFFMSGPAEVIDLKLWANWNVVALLSCLFFRFSTTTVCFHWERTRSWHWCQCLYRDIWVYGNVTKDFTRIRKCQPESLWSWTVSQLVISHVIYMNQNIRRFMFVHGKESTKEHRLVYGVSPWYFESNNLASNRILSVPIRL